jgi:hypothetical protein
MSTLYTRIPAKPTNFRTRYISVAPLLADFGLICVSRPIHMAHRSGTSIFKFYLFC